MRFRTMMVVLSAMAAIGAVGGLTIAAAIDAPRDPFPAPIGHTLSGNCDEPEHANDPECAGPQRAEDDVVDGVGSTQDPTPGATPTASASPDGDISGPCDEAEHANDPRCTGDAADGDRSGRGGGDDVDDDRSGRDQDDDADDDDDDDDNDDADDDADDEDRSGSNSGRG